MSLPNVVIIWLVILSTFILPDKTTDGQARKMGWGMNTNIGNPSNWDGFSVDCSKNIYSFPMSMDMTVISFPANATVKTRQIILPRNGRLVFQSGATTLFNSPSDTCQGVELKFRRTSRADWFDPDNWIESDSLLSVKAIPHVERVPCQYDSVQFPSQTTFNLFISSDVVLHKFFLGDQELTYADIATFMSFGLGKIQFLKNQDTTFELSDSEWEDNDRFICKNYQSDIKQKICSLADCGSDGDDCPNPLRPHGFCCPICGFHLKIEHSGSLGLSPVRRKLKTSLKSLNLGSAAVSTHVTRNAEKWAHIVFIPWMNKTKDVRKIINDIRSFLRDDPSVVETTVSESWDGSSGDANALTSGPTPAGIFMIIVLLITLFTVGVGIYLLCWNRRGQGPVLTMSAVRSRLQQISMPAMPTFNPRRPSFAFARFSNERISSINIGQISSGNIERTDKVDTDTNPIDVNLPEETTTSGIGFANVVYDIIGVNDDNGTPGGGGGGDAELNKSSSLATDMQKEEHVYDLVEVQGASGMGSGLQKSKTIENEE